MTSSNIAIIPSLKKITLKLFHKIALILYQYVNILIENHKFCVSHSANMFSNLVSFTSKEC